MSSTAKQTRSAQKSIPKRKWSFSKRNWFVRLLGDERGAELAEICIASVCCITVVGIAFKAFEGEIPGIARNVMSMLNEAVTKGEMPTNKAVTTNGPTTPGSH